MKRAWLLGSALGCFAGAALMLPAQASDEPGSGLFGYTLTGQSQALQLTEDEPSANSHPEAEADVPQSQISLTNGPVGYALSSIAWPGALGGNAGSLVLLVRPDAPSQVTVLNDPVRAEARSGSASHTQTNTTYPGTTLYANATAALTQATATTDGGSAGQTIGFGTTSSNSKAVLGASLAKVTADSTAKDLSVASVVKIASVVSHAEGTTDGVTASAKGTTSVSGMTVAGVPVTVDSHGVTVATQNGQVDPVAVATVNTALKNINMTIALSSPTQSKDGGTVSYDAGSLTMFWQPPSSVNVFTAAFGGARIVAAATKASTILVVTPPPYVAPVTGGTTGGTASGSGGGTGFQPDPGQPVVPGTPIVPGPVVPAPAGGTTGDPVTSAALRPLADGTGAPTWTIILTALGSVLLLGGLLRVPGLVLLEPRPTRCPLEEQP